jgi:hypothetical protein
VSTSEISLVHKEEKENGAKWWVEVHMNDVSTTKEHEKKGKEENGREKQEE